MEKGILDSFNINSFFFDNKNKIKIMRPRMEALALDLVSKLLVYSPNIRLTPLQALSHPYFDELRDENNIKMM